MGIRLVASIVGLGGMVTADGERLICRKPSGVVLPEDISAGIREQKSEILAALTVASFEETVAYIRSMTDDERFAYEQAIVHDLLAYAVVIGEEGQ